MQKSATVFLTGSTGTLGRFLVSDLQKSGVSLVLPIRAATQKGAEERGKEFSQHGESVHIVRCDLLKEELGLSNDDARFVREQVTHILHAAGGTRFDVSISEARRLNVAMTKRVLDFAKTCKNLQRFAFVSTAFVAGKRSGRILEDEFSHTGGFLNTYEQAKYEAEALVRASADALPLVIFRPSLIITPYERKTRKSPVSALTLGLFLIRKGFVPVLPGRREDSLDMVRGPEVSRAIAALLVNPKLAHLSYHLTSSSYAPKIGEIADLLDEVTGKKLNVRFCGNEDVFRVELQKLIRFRPDLALIYKKISTFVLEMSYAKLFDNRNLAQEGFGEFGKGVLEELRTLVR